MDFVRVFEFNFVFDKDQVIPRINRMSSQWPKRGADLQCTLGSFHDFHYHHLKTIPWLSNHISCVHLKKSEKNSGFFFYFFLGFFSGFFSRFFYVVKIEKKIQKKNPKQNPDIIGYFFRWTQLLSSMSVKLKYLPTKSYIGT